ncbi:caspase family protein [Streptomyces sp. NPDC093252]|uniref:caspase family protein n=1 Tax=Streptomyces sp. NPDC093252 TaxID=3154980 RepID=UPI0034369B5C
MGPRKALLIATGTYEDARWNPLGAPLRDAAELGRVLGDPAVGGYQVTPVLDQPAYAVQRILQRFLTEAARDDELLVYFSCHGIKDYDERLFFAGTDTLREPLLLQSYAVPAAFVSEQLHLCRADRKVLLLDCCFSGAIRPGAKGERPEGQQEPGIGVGGSFRGSGTVVISATDEIQLAFETTPGTDSDDDLSALSVFTAAVVHGLRTGAADLDADGLVSALDLHRYLSAEMLARRTRQTPKLWILDGVGDLVIARGKGAQGPAVPLPVLPAPPDLTVPGVPGVPDSALLPEDMQPDTLSGMEVGAVAYTLPWAMWADENRRLWLHPDYPADAHPGGTVEMKVQRVPGGYHVWAPPDHHYQPGPPAYVGDHGRLPVLKLVR